MWFNCSEFTELLDEFNIDFVYSTKYKVKSLDIREKYINSVTISSLLDRIDAFPEKKLDNYGLHVEYKKDIISNNWTYPNKVDRSR